MLQHLGADCALGQQAACSLQGRMSETHQKLDFKKIVKLTDHTYACNSLTNFKSKTHSLVTKIDVKMQKNS